MFCCGWGGNQFTPLLVLYRERNHFSEVVVDALLGAYVMGLIPALLLGGGRSDRHGRRPLILVAVTSSLLGSLALSAGTLPLLALGRVLCGVGIGLAMAVGSTWVLELSRAGGASGATGARRGSLALTAGLGLGAGVAGLLAQFGPLPESLPYWVHAALTAPVLLALVLRSPRPGSPSPAAPVTPGPAPTGWPAVLATTGFRRRILPLAPWVFAAGGVAYATIPETLAPRIGQSALLYATGLTVVTMAAGFVIQPLAHRFDHPHRPRGLTAALGMVALGMGLATVTAAAGLWWLGGVCAVVLGSALGLAIATGLPELARISPPDDLARSTGIFYALAYVGFLVPTAIAISGQTVLALGTLTGLALLCGLAVLTPARAGSERRPDRRRGLTFMFTRGPARTRGSHRSELPLVLPGELLVAVGDRVDGLGLLLLEPGAMVAVTEHPEGAGDPAVGLQNDAGQDLLPLLEVEPLDVEVGHPDPPGVMSGVLAVMGGDALSEPLEQIGDLGRRVGHLRSASDYRPGPGRGSPDPAH